MHMQRAIRNCRTRVDHQKSLSKCQQQFLPTSNDNLPVREMGCSKFKVQQIQIPGKIVIARFWQKVTWCLMLISQNNGQLIWRLVGNLFANVH